MLVSLLTSLVHIAAACGHGNHCSGHIVVTVLSLDFEMRVPERSWREKLIRNSIPLCQNDSRTSWAGKDSVLSQPMYGAYMIDDSAGLCVQCFELTQLAHELEYA